MIKKDDKYLILSFDTESDIGSWTQNYTSIDIALPKIFDLLKNHGVKATFYWEAKAAMHAPDMVKQAAKQGHECGCHTYQHETVGKPSYFIPGDRAILPDEVYGRLKKNKDLIEKLTGEKALSFRAPRLWGDEVMINTLESLGFQTDSTYPVSNLGDDLFFYHPSRKDLSKEGELEILEIPVMSLFGGMAERAPEVIKEFAVETAGSVEQIGQWPILRLYGANQFVEYTKPYIDEQYKQREYNILTVYQHPWEFIPMPGILDGPEAECRLRRTLYENTGDYALEALDEMIGIYKKMGFTFITPLELHEMIQQGGES